MASTDLLYVDILKIILIVVASFIIIRGAMYIINRTGKRLNLDVTLIQVLNEIIKYTGIVFALTIVLREVGINITAIVLSLGIVGIAVGFAARDTISNFISGMFILGDRSFRVGDIIEMSGQSGKVIKMGLRVTTIISPDNKIITIPNSSFSKNVYINYTSQDTSRVGLDINIPYNKLEESISLMEEVARKCRWAMAEPKPKVIIREMTDTGIKATLNVWTSDPWMVAEYRSQLAKAVKEVLVDENA
ncbi:MAG: mechanosensitive ion channel family protein [Methanobacteriaceae archaeon]